jgi:hypothetical protein
LTEEFVCIAAESRWNGFYLFLCHGQAHDLDLGFVGACGLIST